MSLCDKCNTDVPANNDASIFDAIVMENPVVALFTMPRHLLPVVDGDVVVCSGSPSRAQYIEGQPKDPRGTYPYDSEVEAKFRAAYGTMQGQAAPQQA